MAATNVLNIIRVATTTYIEMSTLTGTCQQARRCWRRGAALLGGTSRVWLWCCAVTAFCWCRSARRHGWLRWHCRGTASLWLHEVRSTCEIILISSPPYESSASDCPSIAVARSRISLPPARGRSRNHTLVRLVRWLVRIGHVLQVHAGGWAGLLWSHPGQPRTC